MTPDQIHALVEIFERISTDEAMQNDVQKSDIRKKCEELKENIKKITNTPEHNTAQAEKMIQTLDGIIKSVSVDQRRPSSVSQAAANESHTHHVQTPRKSG